MAKKYKEEEIMAAVQEEGDINNLVGVSNPKWMMQKTLYTK